MKQQAQSHQRISPLKSWFLTMTGKVQQRGLAWLQQVASCALVASVVLWPAPLTAQAAPA